MKTELRYNLDEAKLAFAVYKRLIRISEKQQHKGYLTIPDREQLIADKIYVGAYFQKLVDPELTGNAEDV